MNWKLLTSTEQLAQIKADSNTKPQIIFKHSTRCSISTVAYNRLEKSAVPDGVDFYYLDLLAHRQVSNAVADVFQVHHESPQVLLIKNGVCIYDESHMAITMDELAEQASLN
jgi:bacillithiol system protein YtxJ